MQQKTIIRGVAIAVTGVAASVFASQHFFGAGTPDLRSASSPAATEQVQGASLIGAGISLRKDAAPSADDTPKAALVLTPAAPATPAAEQVASLDLGSDSQGLPDADFEPKLALADADIHRDQSDCAASLTVNPSIDALLEISLSAPCHGNERVVVSHDDLAFSAQLGATGKFSAYVPALSAQAKVDVFLADDTFLQAEAEISDLDAHSRLIVQWSGPEAFALHAFHNGADFGDAGHLHALNPFDPAIDDAYLISLGDNHGPEPLRAIAYSIPAAQVAQARVVLELALDQNSCGRDVSAFVLQRGPMNTDDFKDFVLATPECGAQDGLVMIDLPLAQPKFGELSQ